MKSKLSLIFPLVLLIGLSLYFLLKRPRRPDSVATEFSKTETEQPKSDNSNLDKASSEQTLEVTLAILEALFEYNASTSRDGGWETPYDAMETLMHNKTRLQAGDAMIKQGLVNLRV